MQSALVSRRRRCSRKEGTHSERQIAAMCSCGQVELIGGRGFGFVLGFLLLEPSPQEIASLASTRGTAARQSHAALSNCLLGRLALFPS